MRNQEESGVAQGSRPTAGVGYAVLGAFPH